MSTKIDDRDRTADGPGTLGDLLYADPSRSRIAEDYWLELVLSIAKGEAPALDELFERTHRIVFTLIMRIVRDRESAEELTLDVFHDVWRRASSYDRAGGTVLGWLMNQARSRAIDRLRFDQRKKRTTTRADAVEPGENEAQAAVELEQHARRLRAALACLTEDERKAIEMAYFSELSYAAVALQLGAPLGTIKTRIRSGLVKLRRALASEVP